MENHRGVLLLKVQATGLAFHISRKEPHFPSHVTGLPLSQTTESRSLPVPMPFDLGKLFLFG